MSEEVYDEPAFPVSTQGYPFGHQDSTSTWQYAGLRKRELFAAIALQGILSGAPGRHQMPENASHDAVRYADALMKALRDTPDDSARRTEGEM